MEALLIFGIAVLTALGAYLVVVGSGAAPGHEEWRRRGKWLGVLYLLAGLVPAALGLTFVLATAFDDNGADEPLDGSFAAGMVTDMDNEVWYVLGGWLLLGGAVVSVGAWCGRRGWPHARAVLAIGLVLLGVPALLVGVGLIYLMLIPVLPFWRHEPAESTG